MNIMTIVILVILALFAWAGLRGGMVNRLEGLLALAISAAVVSVALPTVTKVIKEQTPVYQVIRNQCESTISSLAVSKIKDEDSLNREEVRYYLDTYGMDSSIVDSYSDSQLLSWLSQNLPDYLAQTGQAASDVLNNLTRIEQTKLIQNLPVPDFLQKLMLNYNNSEGYKKLGADTFGSYLVDFIANLILNIVAFLVTLLVSHVIVWGIFRILDLAAHLPVLRGLNRIGGLALGLVEGIVVVWVIFLVISMLSGTQIGVTLMKMIDESVILKPLYESNLLMRLVGGAISGML